jgi:serine/threonine protein kinase
MGAKKSKSAVPPSLAGVFSPSTLNEIVSSLSQRVQALVWAASPDAPTLAAAVGGVFDDPSDAPVLRDGSKTRIAGGSHGSVYAADLVDAATFHGEYRVAIKEVDFSGGSGAVPDDVVVEILGMRATAECESTVRLWLAYMEPCGEEMARLSLVMELCAPQGLGEVAAKLGGLQCAEVKAIARSIIVAIVACHEAKLIHRDIKSDNFVIHRESGRVKLTDFGVAFQAPPRTIESKPDGYPRAPLGGWKPASFIGSPYWMAPELLAARAKGIAYTSAADVYGFGISLIELTDGLPPHFDEEPMAFLSKLHSYEPPSVSAANVPKVDAALLAIVATCVQRRPKDRPTAATLGADPWLAASFDDFAADGLLMQALLERHAAAVALENVEATSRPRRRAPRSSVRSGALSTDEPSKKTSSSTSPSLSLSTAVEEDEGEGEGETAESRRSFRVSRISRETSFRGDSLAPPPTATSVTASPVRYSARSSAASSPRGSALSSPRSTASGRSSGGSSPRKHRSRRASRIAQPPAGNLIPVVESH